MCKDIDFSPRIIQIHTDFYSHGCGCPVVVAACTVCGNCMIQHSAGTLRMNMKNQYSSVSSVPSIRTASGCVNTKLTAAITPKTAAQKHNARKRLMICLLVNGCLTIFSVIKCRFLPKSFFGSCTPGMLRLLNLSHALPETPGAHSHAHLPSFYRTDTRKTAGMHIPSKKDLTLL